MTSSYWQQDLHDYPTSALPSRAEIAIVGGGLVGLSIGLRLAAAGAEVVLVERERVAAGASGRNGGLLLPGTSELYPPLVERWGRTRARELWALAERGADGLVALVEMLEGDGLDCGWRPEGGLHVASSESEAEALRLGAKWLAEDGFDARWLERDALADYSDLELPPGLEGALLVPRGGCLHSGRLLSALAMRATRVGLKVVEATRVLKIDGTGEGSATETGADTGHPAHLIADRDAEHGGLRLMCEGGTLEARQVVVAANAWAARLLPALDGTIQAVRGQVLATAPLPPRRFRGGWSLNEGYEYLQQTDSGRLVVGGMRWTAADRELGYDRHETNPRIQSRLDAFLGASWPELVDSSSGEVPIAHRWAGIMAWTPDRMPLIGAVPGLAGCWMACGFSGHGVPYAMLAAEILASRIEGGAVLAGSRAFDPARFPAP